MKTLIWILMAVAALSHARSQELPADIGNGIAIVPVDKLPKTVPLFFSAAAEVQAQVGAVEILGTQKLIFRVHQGKPEVFSIGLTGKGEITSVTGEQLRDWSVRNAPDGSRLRPQFQHPAAIRSVPHG
ncbi:MAG: hypothetical protein EOP87_24430, partial [Verrucomicrobiaceae bacterium]